MDTRKKIVIYDQKMRRLAYLDKAFDISYTTKKNALWTASFSLPADDHKVEYCQIHNYVELFDNGKRVELFRILPSVQTKSSSTNIINYQCEHVLSTLLDNILFGYHQIGNVGVYTTQVLRYIIDRQLTKNWRLGQVDFARQFEYKWENENLLAALFSVPQPFTENYLCTFDTTSYPWTLNLVRGESEPSCELRYRKNMMGITKTVDPTNIVTRIYPLGYGEGDNQLNIKSINGGVPYLEVSSPYGIKEATFVDRRYEDANSLKAAAQAILNEMSVPYISYAVDAIDLSEKSQSDYDRFIAGKLVHVIDKEDGIEFNAYITETTKRIGEATPQLVIANKEKDIATSISDLQERARIEQTYSQGATNLMQIAYADNADASHPARLKFFVPAEMVRINKLILQYQLDPFRAFSQATGGGGGTTQTTTNGGGVSSTTASGGGTNTTTSAGGEYADTTASGGSTSSTTTSGGGSYETSDVDENIGGRGGHNHGIGTGTLLAIWGGSNEEGLLKGSGYVSWVPSGNHYHELYIPSHKHSFTVPAHRHSFSIGAHNHNFTLAAHSHTFSIAAHSHSMTLKDHTHKITHGIYEGETATSVTIKVDGKTVPVTGGEIDIIKYLSTGDGGKILRDTWHEIEITPNKMTRIVANLFTQLFVNSRGEGDY